MTCLTATEYLWHKWSWICSVYHNHNPVLSFHNSSQETVLINSTTLLCARIEYGRSWVRASVWVKPKTIKLVFAAFLLSMQHLSLITKTGCLRIRTTCLSGVTYYPQVLHNPLWPCILHRLLFHYKNLPKCVCLVQRGHHHHHLIEM